MSWRWRIREGWWELVPAGLPPGLSAGFLARPLAGAPLPLPADRVRLDQIHGSDCARVDEPATVARADAAATDRPGLVLTVRTADCLPVLLEGAEGGVALAHAGWRGLDAGVLETAARTVGAHRAWIGPAIGPCCFEVGEDVAARFGGAIAPLAPRGRPHVDLPREAARRLASVGAAVVGAPAPCTRCHQHLLPSHRGSGGGPARLTAWAALGVPGQPQSP